MPWLRNGTVAVTQNSTTVTGTGTTFTSSRIGDAFNAPDGRRYEVFNIISETVLAIIPAYTGATVSGAAYSIEPVQGYPKALTDAFNAVNQRWGNTLAALGSTGNYDILPVANGGTGRADGRVVFSEVGVQQASAIYNVQGMYMGWNASGTGEGHFIVNRGGGTGGFTWRSVSGANTATGPSMSYSYEGQLSVPQLKLDNALTIANGGTGANSQADALVALNAQPKRASLTALSFDKFEANQVPFFTSSNATSLMTVSPYMRTVLDDNSPAAASDTLGLANGLYKPSFAYCKAAASGNAAIGSGAGLYLGWNESGGTGESNFICNRGGGSGGFTWRSVNNENTASGPAMTYTYAGGLIVPGAVSQGSDRRLKINDKEILDGLSKIMQVRPVEFDRRYSLEDTEYPVHESGVIAQELYEVLPILVTPASEDLGGEVWRVNYTGLIPYLISAMKELNSKIDELKSVIEDLKSERDTAA